MGHSVLNFSEFIIKRIYAKGKVSLKECVDFFLTKQEEFDEKIRQAEMRNAKSKYIEQLKERKKQFGHSTSAGMEWGRGMVSQGFFQVASYHQENEIIEPIIETAEQKELWDKSDNLELDGQDDWDVFDEKILWKFAQGGRQKYLDKEIKHLRYVT